jgi:hypothetical protein
LDKIKVNAIHGISTHSGGQTAFFRNIRGVGTTHDDRRDGPAKQCLDMAETQTAFNTIRSEAFLKEMDRYLFLFDLNYHRVCLWSLPWLANLSA